MKFLRFPFFLSLFFIAFGSCAAEEIQSSSESNKASTSLLQASQAGYSGLMLLDNLSVKCGTYYLTPRVSFANAHCAFAAPLSRFKVGYVDGAGRVQQTRIARIVMPAPLDKLLRQEQARLSEPKQSAGVSLAEAYGSLRRRRFLSHLDIVALVHQQEVHGIDSLPEGTLASRSDRPGRSVEAQMTVRYRKSDRDGLVSHNWFGQAVFVEAQRKSFLYRTDTLRIPHCKYALWNENIDFCRTSNREVPDGGSMLRHLEGVGCESDSGTPVLDSQSNKVVGLFTFISTLPENAAPTRNTNACSYVSWSVDFGWAPIAKFIASLENL